MCKWAVILTMLSAASVAAAADLERETVNQHPVEISAGLIGTDTITAPLLSCDWHLRVELPRRSDRPAWHVNIAYADGSACTIAAARVGQSISDNDYGTPLQITVTRTNADGSSETKEHLLREGIDPAMDGWSLTLRRQPDERMLTCAFGQRSPLFTLPVDCEGITTISAVADTPMKLSRFTAAIDYAANEMTSVADSVDGLMAAIAASGNTADGLWRYLDRDTDPRRLNTGSDYSLATVTAADGTVELVYLSGAKASDSLWKPLMLKGRLLPTVFSGHYDLVWYDAYGQKISAETSADIIDGSILKLNFPLHGGNVRFQRVVTPQ